jgi:hypothetical protein
LADRDGDRRTMRRRPEPLYRRVDTTAHGVRRQLLEPYRRPTGAPTDDAPTMGPMGRGSRSRGYRDYTPLFRFLLARVGSPWPEVEAEAVRRLDRRDPIDWIVATEESRRQPYVRTGESSYFSGLFVDDDAVLRVVDPTVGPSSLEPTCGCCTHTFNGVPFTRRWVPGG